MDAQTLYVSVYIIFMVIPPSLHQPPRCPQANTHAATRICAVLGSIYLHVLAEKYYIQYGVTAAAAILRR